MQTEVLEEGQAQPSSTEINDKDCKAEAYKAHSSASPRTRQKRATTACRMAKHNRMQARRRLQNARPKNGEAHPSARLYLRVESPAKASPMKSPPSSTEQVPRAECCTVGKMSDLNFKEGGKREGSRSQSWYRQKQGEGNLSRSGSYSASVALRCCAVKQLQPDGDAWKGG